MFTHLNITTAQSFTTGEEITGGTSGATAKIFDAPTSTTLRLTDELSDFQNEGITGGSSSATDTISAITAGDIKNGYVPVTDAITGVVRVFPFTNNTQIDMFDVRYQMRLNELFDLANTSVLYYNMVQSHLSLIDELLVGKKSIRFNRHSDRIHVDMDWNADIKADEYLVFEVYRILDPQTYTDVYNDMFLKKYLTALLKLQWGNNLSKFSGVQMPGGVTLDGVRIMEEARTEIEKIEEEMSLRYELPVNMMVGWLYGT